MSSLAPGARQLPLRHLSVRVPWNDTDWTGCVCRKPGDNISCLILARIEKLVTMGRRRRWRRNHGKRWMRPSFRPA